MPDRPAALLLPAMWELHVSRNGQSFRAAVGPRWWCAFWRGIYRKVPFWTGVAMNEVRPSR